MRLVASYTIFRKEMVDMLRDKRTLVATLVIPLVLYPALFLIGSQVAVSEQTKLEKTPSRVAVGSKDETGLATWLETIPMVDCRQVADPETALAAGDIDAWVAGEGHVGGTSDSGGTARIAIRYDASETRSWEAARRLADGLEDKAREIREERMAALDRPAEYGEPFEVSRENMAPPSKAAGTVLGMILPIIMVVMVGIGAFYPAIDLTAGEKERGTLETLLSTPVTTAEIVHGKFLAVFLLSLFTGLLNLGSMLLTFALALNQLQGQFGEQVLQIPGGTVLLIVLTLLPLALLVSAIMMSVAVCARSFREGQNLVTPFLLLMLFPAAYVAVPGSELTHTTQLLPITNVALLFKELMGAKMSFEHVFVVLGSTTVYALLALMLASWLFTREDVVLSEERGVPLTWRRSAFEPRETPTPGMSLLIFTVSMLLIFYVGSSWQLRDAVSGMLVTQWVLILLPPLALLWYWRVDLAQALQLRIPGAGAVAGAVLIAGAWVVLAIQVTHWQNRLVPMPEAMAEEMARMLSPEATGLGVWGILFIAAVSPAICEEVLFRGALLSAFRTRLPGWAAIGASAVLFGIMHLSYYRAGAVIASGLVIGYIVWRSRSLWLGMLAHVTLNTCGLLAQMGHVPANLHAFFESSQFDNHGLPWPVLAAAAAVFATGVVVMERSGPRVVDAWDRLQ